MTYKKWPITSIWSTIKNGSNFESFDSNSRLFLENHTHKDRENLKLYFHIMLIYYYRFLELNSLEDYTTLFNKSPLSFELSDEVYFPIIKHKQVINYSHEMKPNNLTYIFKSDRTFKINSKT